jgi:hypothetical protein
MHLPAVALLVPLLACLPHPTLAAPEGSHRSGPWRFELEGEDGRPLATFGHRGRTWVLGERGSRYLVRFHNHSGRRVEVVATVDGLDVVDGRPGSLAKRGYLVEPHGDLTIDGFRLSQEAVAAFRFSSVAASYAARKGDARDVGVIGLAVFPEREPLRWSPPLSLGAAPPRASGEAARDQAPAEARAKAAPAPDARGELQAERRPGLGTGFGEEHFSHVDQVAFERASDRPEAVLTVRYDDRPGLLALGIDLDGRMARRDEGWRRERAQPFPGSSGYAEPPSGWSP